MNWYPTLVFYMGLLDAGLIWSCFGHIDRIKRCCGNNSWCNALADWIIEVSIHYH